ncbi:MAG: XRE family transcriptional regulator [Dehalococcoidia bacterium]|nr:XRE family transcriptional regulator [Dehalococcoidia bacterium]
MSEINCEIGERIKGIRTLNKLSLEEFAKQLSITPEQLTQYENGNVEISVSFLHDVSRQFDISMTELLSGESAKLSVYSVVRKGKGVGVSRRKEYDYQSLAYNFADRTIDPYYITIEPKPDDNTASLVWHAGQEFHYVLDGTVRVKIDKHETILHEGDSVYFDSTYPHSIEALGDKTAHLVVTITGKE